MASVGVAGREVDPSGATCAVLEECRRGASGSTTIGGCVSSFLVDFPGGRPLRRFGVSIDWSSDVGDDSFGSVVAVAC